MSNIIKEDALNKKRFGKFLDGVAPDLKGQAESIKPMTEEERSKMWEDGLTKIKEIEDSK